jgi:predicted GIY-YIG superfamily endonuclease
MGQVSSQLLSILDMIMRRIRKSTHWMGGVLILATMDVQQLRPIHGLPPLLSPCMISSFVYHEFLITLRTNDCHLQRIQAITRKSVRDFENEPGLKEEFRSLIKTYCMFVDNINDHRIPTDSTIYCFARHELCKKAEAKVLEKAKRRFGHRMVMRKSIDWEQTRHRTYSSLASSSTSNALDSVAKVPRKLSFFPYAAYEFTYNDSGGRFFQSQLCMVLDHNLPTQTELDDWVEIEVYQAPQGLDEMPSVPINEATLLKAGWVKIKVGKQPVDRAKYNLGNDGLYAWREQYGLRHRISMTIHSVMGSTVPKLVCQIGRGRQETLWEAAQVIVLLSRTRHANDIFFIGQANEVADVLWGALLQRDQFTEYINYLLKSLCHGKDTEGPFIIDQTLLHPFRPKDIQLPQANDYCCYMLVSLSDPTNTYIGQTDNLRRRINDHNSSQRGSLSTNRPKLKPWALLAYVVGFESREKSRAFENSWQHLVTNRQLLRPVDRAHMAEEAITDYDRREQNRVANYQQLRFVICGSMDDTSGSTEERRNET